MTPYKPANTMQTASETLPAPKTGLATRVKNGLARLPKFEDENQRRAGGNLLKFLALILLLTLVARGTSGATLAKVQVSPLAAGEVVQQVSASGTVQAAESREVRAPEGLRPEALLVSAGQKVSEGDALARFDEANVADALARAKLALEETQAGIDAARANDALDSTAITGAQTRINRADSDYNAAKNAGQSGVNAAQAALDNAKAALQTANESLAARQSERDAAQATLNALPADADEAQHTAAQAALTEADAALTEAASVVATAQTEVNTAETALSTAKATADSDLKQAEREKEDARLNLESQKTAQANSQRAAAQTARTGELKAQGLELDAINQQKLVGELEDLHNAGGVLYSGVAGTVMAVGSLETEGGSLVRISDDSQGYIAEAVVPKADAQKLVAGADVDVETGSGYYYSNTAKGKLLAIGDENESGSVTLKVQLPEADWKHGDSVNLKAVQSRQQYTSTVPISALHADGNDYYVLVTEQTNGVLGIQESVKKIPVTVTARDGSRAAIEGPLDSTARIITSATKPVASGDRVRVEA